MAISNKLRKLVDPNNECCCEYCLGNKCKEWARNEGYWVQSGLRGTGGAYAEFGRYHNTDNKMIDSLDYTATEPEAIFRACQWLLDKDKVCQT